MPGAAPSLREKDREDDQHAAITFNLQHPS